MATCAAHQGGRRRRGRRKKSVGGVFITRKDDHKGGLFTGGRGRGRGKKKGREEVPF